jgi:Cd2+-exporting ATPase
MACRSGYCSPPVEPAPKQYSPAQSLIRDDNDICCDERNLTVDQASKDACCSNKELRHPAITKSACNDSYRGDSNEPMQDQCGKHTKASVVGSRQDTRCSGLSEQIKKGDCCGSIKGIEDDGCRPPEIVSTGCQNACCGGPAEETQGGVGCGMRDTKVDDEYWAPQPIDHGCRKNCRSAPEPSRVEDLDGPSCCKDKVFPCCDVSCLDRIALRECENEKRAAQIDEASKSKLNCDPSASTLLLTSYSSHRISGKLQMPRRQRRQTMRPAHSYHS